MRTEKIRGEEYTILETTDWEENGCLICCFNKTGTCEGCPDNCCLEDNEYYSPKIINMKSQEFIDLNNKRVETDSIKERAELTETLDQALREFIEKKFNIIRNLCHVGKVDTSLLSDLPCTTFASNFYIGHSNDEYIEVEYVKNCGDYSDDRSCRIQRQWIDGTDKEFFEEMKEKLVKEFERTIEETKARLKMYEEELETVKNYAYGNLERATER